MPDAAVAGAGGSLVDVAGLQVGHARLAGRDSGCSVVLCTAGAVCGVAVRGAAPGTRETDLLRPEASVQRVHAVLLSGGSAFGLDAAAGVMRWLEQHGHGLAVGGVRVPIVPAAVLFDLGHGDPALRPDASTGFAACEDALSATGGAIRQGRVGAGRGATVGKLFGAAHACWGGIGTAALRVGAHTVAALVAVNAVGDVLGEDGRVLAGARDAGCGDGSGWLGSTAAWLADSTAGAALSATSLAGTATTIGVVATDAALDKAGATQLARLAHHGLSRAISPVTVHDGDSLFALATAAEPAPADLGRLGAAAAEVVARAIRNAVRAAAAAPA